MRFRPRFSVRTLAIFVTLVCAYFAAWEATKKFGIPSVTYKVKQPPGVVGGLIHADTVTSVIPFLVGLDEQRPEDTAMQINDPFYCPSLRLRTHYFWFFGVIVRTPVQWEYVPSYD